MPKGIFKRTLEHNKKISLALIGKKKSPLHVYHMSIAMKGVGIGRKRSKESIIKWKRFGAEHHAWKGDDVSYVTKHQRFYRFFGKANQCEINPEHKNRLYEWHNLSGQYKRERSDWQMLCISCHRKIDYQKRSKNNG